MRGRDKKPVTLLPHLSAVNQQIFITKILHELCWSPPTKKQLSGLKQLRIAGSSCHYLQSHIWQHH